ncbi:hypothetical protein [Streptomyces sp. NPDC101132]|uniref:hypothetical protein n=1 Tax=Streptomyces sp. NPDC101132 TaxID=3366110 RepID=UPI003816B226
MAEAPDRAAPADPPVPPPPTGWSTYLDNAAPGVRELPRRQRWRYVAVTLAAAFAGALGAYLVSLALDAATAETVIKVTKDAEDRVDRAEKPFTAQVTHPDRSTADADFPGVWMIVLDHRLTAAEQERLAAIRPERDSKAFGRRVWALLRPLGGRLIEFAPMIPNASSAHAQRFRLTLFSDRQAGLSVKDMRARVDSCVPSSARTLVVNVPAGNSPVAGIAWDVGERSEVALVADDGEAQGRPFFDEFQIDLGNGQAPGGLQVTALIGNGQTCRWHIDAYYEDTEGRHPAVRIQDGGRPLVTEGPPARPRLLFQMDPKPAGGPWGCLGEVETTACVPEPQPMARPDGVGSGATP